MKNDIQELYDSIQIKKAMQELNITNVSELKEYNCVTLANKLRTGYNKLMIIRKLNDLGYLSSAENTISIYDIPMLLSVKLDAPAPCRLVASDLDFACRASADCLPQHLQVI